VREIDKKKHPRDDFVKERLSKKTSTTLELVSKNYRDWLLIK
jgi:hypothetical protein